MKATVTFASRLADWDPGPDPLLRRLWAMCTGDGRELDVLEVGLTLAALRRGGRADLAPYREQVRAMSAAVADLVRRRGAGPERLGEILAGAYALRGDRETYDDPANADLIDVLERKRGLPVALAIIYMHVARDQGWEAVGTAFPRHFLIRIGIDGARHLVDPFHDGAAPDGAELKTLAGRVLGRETALDPAFLDPVLDRDVVLRLENNHCLRAGQAGDQAEVAASLARMVAMSPDSAELLVAAAEAEIALDRRRAALRYLERLEALLESWPGAPERLRQRAHDLLREQKRGLN
ncbi:MAG: hypothetical protein FJX02_03205 [Alphaproteobacteria bacterium]|nr:hypothetical protein [Alphaproteobacteria bacterium]